MGGGEASEQGKQARGPDDALSSCPGRHKQYRSYLDLLDPLQQLQHSKTDWDWYWAATRRQDLVGEDCKTCPAVHLSLLRGRQTGRVRDIGREVFRFGGRCWGRSVGWQVARG